MKIILFNFDNISSEKDDWTDAGVSDEEFIEIAKEDTDYLIFNNLKEFEYAFNAELFSTATHQIRIIENE